MKFLKYYESFGEKKTVMTFTIDDIRKIIVNSYKTDKGLPDQNMEEILNCEWIDIAEVDSLWYHMNPSTRPDAIESDVADFKDRPSAEEIYNYIQSHPSEYSKKLKDLNDKTGIFEHTIVDTSKYDSYRTKYDLEEGEIDAIIRANKMSHEAYNLTIQELLREYNITMATVERILDLHEFGFDGSSKALPREQRLSSKDVYNYLQHYKETHPLEFSKKAVDFNKKTGLYN